MRTWLKKLRIDHGFNQGDMATALGLTQTYYCMIESGQRMKGLSLDLAQKIAELLGITLEQVVIFESELKKK